MNFWESKNGFEVMYELICAINKLTKEVKELKEQLNTKED